MSARGFGVAAGLDPEVATPLAARCEELGYTSMWANDHPAASGLETLAAFAEGSAAMQLGVGVLAIDRHPPAAINEKIEALGLDRSRLLIGVGAGFSEKPLTAMRETHDELREAIPGVKLVLAAMGPKMCALAGASYDGAFFNWVTPDYAAEARGNVEAGAADAGRATPPRLRLRPHLGRRRRRDPPRQGRGLLPRPPRRLPPPVRAARPAARHRRRRRREPRRRRRDAQRLRGPRHRRGPRPGQRQAGGHGPGGDGGGAQVAPAEMLRLRRPVRRSARGAEP